MKFLMPISTHVACAAKVNSNKKSGFWNCVSKVTLVGGVTINHGHIIGLVGGKDFLQPLILNSLTANDEEDIYGEIFGDSIANDMASTKYV